METNKDHLKLTTVLFRTMQHVSAVIKQDITSHSLNTTEFGTLELLYNRGRQPIQSIAQRLLMANSSMTYVVDKLEERGLITRTTDVIDRRMTMIELTHDGRVFFENIFPKHVETLHTMYQQLNEQELETLISHLKKVGYQAMAMNTNIK